MKDKFLVDLYVPAVGKHYEIWIPENVTIREMKDLCAKAIADLSNGQYARHDNMVIMNQVNGYIYDDEVIIKNTDINNGINLIMI